MVEELRRCRLLRPRPAMPMNTLAPPNLTPPPLRSPFRWRPARPRGPDHHRPRPARVTAIYLGLSVIWILLTDTALGWADLPAAAAARVQSAKGVGFVVLSAGLLHWLVRREVRAVARAQDLLRAVADGTPDAVFAKDRDGKYLLFNEAAARFVGKPVAEVLGRDDTALFDPAGAAAVMARDRRVAETEVGETEEEVLTAAGVTRVYLATKAPCRDAAGAVVGVIGISRDVTDRKRAEEALRASEARFRVFVEQATDAFFLHGDGGVIVDANRQA
ncbi:MAG TPA: PAS domain-containing protein, partial [Urbifossiella sp.]|nr:PAS domain-containing protein [Urbifossiella sp.]